jgi:hypothetical protein
MSADGLMRCQPCRACVISALRLQTLHPSTTSKDPSWDKVPSSMYALIEINVGIACASVVTLRPLYRHLRVAIVGSDEATDHSFDKSIARGPQPWMMRRDGISLITGETTQVGSDSYGEVELGEGMGKGRERSTSSVTAKSLARSETVVSGTDKQRPESKPGSKE